MAKEDKYSGKGNLHSRKLGKMEEAGKRNSERRGPSSSDESVG